MPMCGGEILFKNLTGFKGKSLWRHPEAIILGRIGERHEARSTSSEPPGGAGSPVLGSPSLRTRSPPQPGVCALVRTRPSQTCGQRRLRLPRSAPLSRLGAGTCAHLHPRTCEPTRRRVRTPSLPDLIPLSLRVDACAPHLRRVGPVPGDPRISGEPRFLALSWSA